MSSQNQITKVQRGGKKAKKYKKHVEIKDHTKAIIKVEGQEYALVTKILGGGTYNVRIIGANNELIAHKRGKHEKGSNRANFDVNNVILVNLREYQPKVCDIVCLYSDQEVRYLVKIGELPEIKTDASDVQKILQEEDDVIFEDI